MNRRMIGLMLFSALVHPAQAIAAGCDLQNLDRITDSAGYKIAKGAIKGAVYGAMAVGAASVLFGVAATAPVSILLFSGVTIATGVWPAMSSIKDDSVNVLEKAMESF